MAKRPRDTCPKCGRVNTPIRNNGAFCDHYPWGGGTWCLGPKNYNYYMGGLGHEPFDNAILYARDKRSEDMGSKPTVEYLLERRALLDQEIERQIATEARFGRDEDYEAGFVISADRSFDSGPEHVYTYLFLKIRNGLWYSTAAYDSYGIHKKMTWNQLVDFLAYCETVHYVAKWEAM